ncbi:MAG: hypothetical protein OHK0039_18030 [Bacteroidia bacterium]
MLQRMPALAGEPDVLKSLALLPGVALGSEVSSGLWVRGGSPDQTLILLDGAPVYNVSHLFGFLSAFHPSALSDVTLYKGAFPARYGGRLSGVLDMSMKEGHRQAHRQQLQLGPISASGLVEGPLAQAQGSYLVSGRLAHTALVLFPFHLAYRRGAAENSFYAGFYDLNAKVNWATGRQGRLYLSFYGGQDSWQVAQGKSEGDESRLDLAWGNQVLSTRWVRPLGALHVLKLRGYLSRYQRQSAQSSQQQALGLGGRDTLLRQSATVVSNLSEAQLSVEMDSYLRPGLTWQHGLSLAYRSLAPEVLNSTLPSTPSARVVRQPWIAFYSEIKGQFRPRWHVRLGGRGVWLRSLACGFWSFQPRAGLSYEGRTWAWSLAFSRMQQELHLLANNGLGLPNEIWVPATAALPPQQAWQGSTQLRWEATAGWRFSLEAYFKRMTDLVSFQQGANPLGSFDTGWEELVQAAGDGRGYGAEAMLSRHQGRWQGWLAYEWSRQERQFDRVNRGAWYPARYDRRHQVEAVVQFQIDEQWLCAANATYQSGHPITMPVALLPDASHSLPGADVWQLAFVYGDRNNLRMPAYHRLDLSATKTVADHSWTLGVYNLYGRQNPFFLDIQRRSIQQNGQQVSTRQLVRYSLLPFIPYISYQKFW